MMINQLYKTIFVMVLTAITLGASAQVGGDSSPLQHSRHTYSIVMGYEANSPSWRIFSDHLSVADIEGGSYTPLTRNVAYSVVLDDIDGTDAIFKVEFNGTMTAGNYTMAYKENTADDCFKTEILQFVLHPSFDVDVALLVAGDLQDCGDLSGDPQLPGFTAFKTTIPYAVNLVSPDAGTGYEGSQWSFRFTVSAVGQSGGTSATIESVGLDFNGDGIDQTLTPGALASVYSETVLVSNLPAVSLVVLQVTYNDVLGVSQNVRCELTEIEGAYLEIDADNSNRVDHEIYAMPAAGDIIALN